MEIQKITVEHVTHEYPGAIKALNDLSLQISRGVFGLLGANGAGKTTLLRILATLLPPTAGEARLGPYVTTRRRDQWLIRACLGYVPQDTPLYSHLTGQEFLAYMAAVKRLGSARYRREAVACAIHQTGLTDVAHRRIHTYSGGMKRRVALAQALLGIPQVVIADEPMAGLDPQERIRFRTLIGELGQRCLVLVSSHIVEDLAHMCDAMGVLQAGQLRFQGTPSDLVAVAQGHVWTLAGELPVPGDSFVVSQGRPGLPHRLLGDQPPHPHATPAAPTAEDGYLWLTRLKISSIPALSEDRSRTGGA